MPIDPILGGAIVSGIGGLFSSILGNRSQKSANETNMEIAQMNNEWSEKMMDKQNNFNLQQWMREAAWNEDMWNKQNEYNSAKSQVERYREAGLNPALMMSGQGAGTASAMSAPKGSSVGLPSPSSAQVQGLDYSGFSKAIESSLMLASSLSKQQAETDFINTQRDVMAAKAKAELAKFQQETRGLKWNNDYNQALESVKAATENEQYLDLVQNRLVKEQQITLMKQTEALNDIQISNLPDQMKADIALKIAQADNMSLTEFAKDLKFFEKRFGVKISKSDLKVIFDAWKQNIETQQYRGLNPFNFGIGILNRE